jgi:hypothetical protein
MPGLDDAAGQSRGEQQQTENDENLADMAAHGELLTDEKR